MPDRAIIILGLLSLLLPACHASPTATLPFSPTVPITPTPSATTWPSPSATPTPSLTPTLTPVVITVEPPTPSPTLTPSPSPTPTSTPTHTPTPSPTPSPTPGPWVFGQSAGGRDMVAWRFGHGPTAVALVGGIHGGLEWNTTELVEALRDHLLANPGLLPGEVRLLLLPLANPDGAAAGVGLAGGVNANGVDLNRGWDVEREHDPQRGKQVLSPETDHLSEPEAAALYALLIRENIQAILLYHSFDAPCLHGGIFPGSGPASASLAAVMAEATGYPVSPSGADYFTNSSLAGWLAAQGLAAVDVHLPDRFQLDWEANLAGMVALIRWAIAPGAPSLSGTPTPVSNPSPPWTTPSPLYGDLAAGYPLAVEGERFTLHYQPGTLADGDTAYLVALTERALAHVNEMLAVSPNWHFDLYVAGTPFASPGETSRGYSMSALRRVFYRYDDSGPLVEFESGLAHELTHLTALNEFEPASSVMISEGLAVYVQWSILEAAGWLALDGFCAGMQSAGVMPSLLYLVSDEARYWGYLDQDNYMASGCFVAFLVDRWGIETVARLYSSADWQGVTGLTLAELDELWAEAMADLADEVPVDGAAMVEMEAAMAGAYAHQATHLQQVWALDGLRVTWRMGRFDKARAYADEFRALTAGQ